MPLLAELIENNLAFSRTPDEQDLIPIVKKIDPQVTAGL
jgi:hypothetical protein